MRTRRFDTFEVLTREAAVLLKAHFEASAECPYAVMLSGGNTPMPIYRLLAHEPLKPSPQLHLLYSDERLVPMHSSENNYGNTMDMVRALRLPDARILRVRTELPLQAAADRYDRDIAQFLAQGGQLPLGLLGLGSDGHTASIFTAEDAALGDDRWAVAVPRPQKPDRVSVTPACLSRVQQIVFIATGVDKAAIVQRFKSEPLSMPAGQAVAGVRHVELWYTQDAG